jgi:hypothetical protein
MDQGREEETEKNAEAGGQIRRERIVFFQLCRTDLSQATQPRFMYANTEIVKRKYAIGIEVSREDSPMLRFAHELFRTSEISSCI